MPRIPRIAIPGIALHVVQRGNNRQAVFFTQSDYDAYLNFLPLRAGMVEYPGEYRWSSYRHNAVKLSEYPIRPHDEWLALGSSAQERRKRYAELVAEGMGNDETDTLRRGTRKGLPSGSNRFKREIERALAVRIGSGRRGRPKKGL